MPSRSDFEGGRRVLVAAGTAHYERLTDRDLPEVPEELDRIVALFRGLDYPTALVKRNPDHVELEQHFADAKADSQTGDVVVAYYTGHGAKDPDDERFYLLTRDSMADRMESTALAAEDLARALIKGSQASQILVILDCCYAAAGTRDMQAIADRVSRRVTGPEFCLIAAARPKQEADEGALSEALEHALANRAGRLGGYAQPYLFLEEVMQEVDDYLAERHPRQVATLQFSGIRSRFFPNPRFHAELRASLDLESQRAYREHWIVKARGVELGASGWYFTGREQALRELASWLAGECSDGRVRVVTGGAGCGKSALLARVVTLANATYRDEILAQASSQWIDPSTVPPELPIIAVHARRKLLRDVIAQLAAGLASNASDARALVAELAEAKRKVVLVIDALDEADEREQITIALLRALCGLEHVFVIVGTRPDSPERRRRFRALGESAVEIDLDDPRYVGTGDIARYVERRLLATEEPDRWSPYRDAPEVAGTLASEIAARSGNVFLVAYTAVQALLASASRVDISRAGWADSLPVGIDAAFAQFLAQLDRVPAAGVSRAVAESVLLPLAFAGGEGLPWVDLWSAAATALSQTPITDGDIAAIREHAAAFIIEASERDRSVYRLYHERIADYLRRTLPDGEAAHHRMFEGLRARVPSREGDATPDWARAHPYLLSHLGEHAALAGRMDELLLDPGFLSLADGARLLPWLSSAHSDDARAAVNAYRRAAHAMAEAAPDERIGYLELACQQMRAGALGKAISALTSERRWRVRWTNWFSSQPSRIVLTMAHYIYALALTEHEGRAVVIAADGKGVAAQYLEGAALWAAPLQAYSLAVWNGATGSRVLVGCYDGSLHWLDLADGHDCGSVADAHGSTPEGDATVRAVQIARLEGVDVAVTAGNDGTIAVWDLGSRTRIGQPIAAFTGSIQSLAVAEEGGRVIVVAAASAGQGQETELLRSWDLRTRAPLRRFATEGDALPGALVLTRRDGALWIVASTVRKGIHAIEFATGKRLPFSSSLQQTLSVGVAVGRADGDAIVACGLDVDVALWRLSDGRPMGRLAGHDGVVIALALASIRGRATIVSGGTDCCVRVWDVSDALAAAAPEYGRLSAIVRLATAAMPARNVLVSGAAGLRFDLWDSASGEHLERFDARRWSAVLEPDDFPIAAACGAADEVTVLVGGNGRTLVFTLHPGGDRASAGAIEHAGSAVSALASGEFHGQPLVAAAHVDTSSAGAPADVRFMLVAPKLREAGKLQLQSRVARYIALSRRSEALAAYQPGPSGIVVWDLVADQSLASGLGAKFNVQAIAVERSDDGETLIAAGAYDGEVALWRIGAAGAPQEHVFRRHGDAVRAIALARLGSEIVVLSGGDDRNAIVATLEGREIARVALGAEITAICDVGDGEAVFGTSQGIVRLAFTLSSAR